MTCRGCRESRKLIRAHIIPQAFFTPLRGTDGEAPRLLSNIEGTFAKRIPIGVYDRSILCRECEDRFAIADDYGQRLLLQEEEGHQPVFHGRDIVGWTVPDFEPELLKRFFLSVLWRASVSTHDFYKKVYLGPFEEIVRSLLWKQECGTREQFSCLLAKFTTHPYGRLTLSPHPERWYGVNYYRIYLCGYVLMIKVDSRATPDRFVQYVVGATPALTIFGRKMDRAPELDVIKSITEYERSRA